MFRDEKRTSAFGIEVDAPFDARGIMLMTYRYKASLGPKADARKNDDTWVYVPTLRRVRRISSAQRTDAVSGTDFTFDDLCSFNGIVPQYEWKCLGEMDMIAPIEHQGEGLPVREGPQLRPLRALLRRRPLGAAPRRSRSASRRTTRTIPYQPQGHLHRQADSMEPLYSFAYDRKGELWKIIWHNHRWSEDTALTTRAGTRAGRACDKPRDLTRGQRHRS